MQIRVLYLLGVILSLFSFEMGQAQNAQTVLDRTLSLLKGDKGIEFVYTVEGSMGQGMEGTSSGFIQLKGDKFYLYMPETETWFNGKTLWVWMKDVGEVNISNPIDVELQMISPFALLKRTKDFKVSLEEKKTKDGEMIDRLIFIPIKENSDIKFISLDIQKKSSEPIGLELILNSGAKQKITITKMKKDIYLKDTHFEFDVKNHLGVEIVDLR